MLALYLGESSVVNDLVDYLEWAGRHAQSSSHVNGPRNGHIVLDVPRLVLIATSPLQASYFTASKFASACVERIVFIDDIDGDTGGVHRDWAIDVTGIASLRPDADGRAKAASLANQYDIPFIGIPPTSASPTINSKYTPTHNPETTIFFVAADSAGATTTLARATASRGPGLHSDAKHDVVDLSFRSLDKQDSTHSALEKLAHGAVPNGAIGLFSVELAVPVPTSDSAEASVLGIDDTLDGILLRAFHQFFGINLISLLASRLSNGVSLDTSIFSAQHSVHWPVMVRYVVPNGRGLEMILERTDFLRYQLRSYTSHPSLIIQVATFVRAGTRLPPVSSTTRSNLYVRRDSVGAVLAYGDAARAFMDDVFSKRVFIPTVPPEHYKPNPVLVLVGGGLTYERSYHASEAASQLGIDLIIIGPPGHYYENPGPNIPLAHHPKVFLPMDMTSDAGLADRIVETVSAYGLDKIHGICTSTDSAIIATSIAAKRLNLPTFGSPELYRPCIDKAAFRLLSPIPGTATRTTFSSREDLERLVASDELPPFPLVIKPTVGSGSQGVFKATSKEHLFELFDKFMDFGRSVLVHHSDVMIEPYITGAEVDVNVVLQDGHLLFAEVSDNLPCLGDMADDDKYKKARLKDADPSGILHNCFWEIAEVFPSALPVSQQALLVKEAVDIVRRIGFETGVFHVEARLDDRFGGGGSQSHGVVILEVNPRPPGGQIPIPTAQIYGVDYIGALFTLSLGRDLTRSGTMRPFLNSPRADRLVVLPLPSAPKQSCAMVAVDTVWNPSAAAVTVIEAYPERCVIGLMPAVKGGVQLDDRDSFWAPLFAAQQQQAQAQTLGPESFDGPDFAILRTTFLYPKGSRVPHPRDGFISLYGDVILSTRSLNHEAFVNKALDLFSQCIPHLDQDEAKVDPTVQPSLAISSVPHSTPAGTRKGGDRIGNGPTGMPIGSQGARGDDRYVR